jgi:hypothetical protein
MNTRIDRSGIAFAVHEVERATGPLPTERVNRFRRDPILHWSRSSEVSLTAPHLGEFCYESARLGELHFALRAVSNPEMPRRYNARM